MNVLPNAASRSKVLFLIVFLFPQHLWARTNAAIRAFNEGVKYFNAKQFNEAIPRFDEAISGDPDFVEALFARGACKYYLKSMDGALIDLNETLRLKPEYQAARALRGAVNYESDRWDDALGDFNAVLKEDPHDAQSLLGRAVILLKRNDFPGASRDFRGFLSVRPDDPLAPRVRQLLASLKRAPAESVPIGAPPAEGGSPEASVPVHHPHRAPTAESLNKLADGLLSSPLTESYSRRVLRGENTEAVGDIHSHPGIPRDREDSDGGMEIVEPR